MIRHFGIVEKCLLVTISILLSTRAAHAFYTQPQIEPQLGTERVVFQTDFGDIEFGFYPQVAPRTVAHISRLAHLGCYATNHFFRVDKGFVAQVADVVGGRQVPLSAQQRWEAEQTVPGEFSALPHRRGTLSMARYDDPNSGTSSFSMLLGDAPHLDGKYAVFGRVTAGDEVLARMEALPTRTEGIFVMPLNRISILATYVYDLPGAVPDPICHEDRELLRRKLVQMDDELQRTVSTSLRVGERIK
ncbi:unnamed protein product [Closterium sp. NIES-53]